MRFTHSGSYQFPLIMQCGFIKAVHNRIMCILKFRFDDLVVVVVEEILDVRKDLFQKVRANGSEAATVICEKTHPKNGADKLEIMDILRVRCNGRRSSTCTAANNFTALRLTSSKIGIPALS